MEPANRNGGFYCAVILLLCNAAVFFTLWLLFGK
jgi:hypothetical protein